MSADAACVVEREGMGLVVVQRTPRPLVDCLLVKRDGLCLAGAETRRSPVWSLMLARCTSRSSRRSSD